MHTMLNQPPVSTVQHVFFFFFFFFWLAALNRCFLEKLLLLLGNNRKPHLKHDALLLKELCSSDTLCPLDFKQGEYTAVKTRAC